MSDEKVVDETHRIANKRGKRLAKLADEGKSIPQELVISFEDPGDLLKLLTAARLDLFRTIKAHPDSITCIARRLNRDRSAVKRDVDQRAEAGLVLIEKQIHPGHGQMKQVRVAAENFRLEAQFA